MRPVRVFLIALAVRRSLSACSGGKYLYRPRLLQIGFDILTFYFRASFIEDFTERRVISAISPSSRKIKRRSLATAPAGQKR